MEKKEKTVKPFSYSDIPFFERVFHSWVTPFIFGSAFQCCFENQKKTAVDFIPELPRPLSAHSMDRKMGNCFLSLSKNNFTIYMTILWVFKKELFCALGLEIFKILIFLAQPYVLKVVLQNVFPTKTTDDWIKYPMVGLLFILLYSFLDLLNSYLMKCIRQIYYSSYCGIKSGINGIVFKKILRLKKLEISALEKRNYSFSSFVMVESYDSGFLLMSIVELLVAIINILISSVYLYLNLSWPGLLVYTVVVGFMPIGFVLFFGLIGAYYCFAKNTNYFTRFMSKVYKTIKYIKYNVLERIYLKQIRRTQVRGMFLPLYFYALFDQAVGSLDLIVNAVSKILIFSFTTIFNVQLFEYHIVFSSMFVIDRITQSVKSVLRSLIFLSWTIVGTKRIMDFLKLDEKEGSLEETSKPIHHTSESESEESQTTTTTTDTSASSSDTSDTSDSSTSESDLVNSSTTSTDFSSHFVSTEDESSAFSSSSAEESESLNTSRFSSYHPRNQISIDILNKKFLVFNEPLAESKAKKKKKKKKKKDVEKTRNFFEISNMQVIPGDFVGIVGGTGSGKTSLFYSLLGEFDDHPLKRREKKEKKKTKKQKVKKNEEEELEELENQNSIFEVNGTVSYCPQVPFIFNETLRENVTMGEEFEKERFKQVMRACKLQKEFPTSKFEISQAGTTVSGGQKLRIGLCRCIYRDRDIYLIDDIFPHLDKTVRMKVFRELKRFLYGKTVLLVTNNPEMLRKCDRIIQVKNMRASRVKSVRKVDDKDDYIFSQFFNKNEDDEQESNLNEIALVEGGPRGKEKEEEDGEEDEEFDLDSHRSRRRRQQGGDVDEEKEKQVSRIGEEDEKLVTLTEEEKIPNLSVWTLLKFYARNFAFLSVWKKLFFIFFLVVSFVFLKLVQHFLNIWLVFWPKDVLKLEPKVYFWVYVGVGIFYPVFHFIYTNLTVYSAARTGLNIQTEVLVKSLQAKMSMFYKTPIGRILNVIGGDYFRTAWVLILLSSICSHVVDIVVTLVNMTLTNPFAVIPAILLVIAFYITNDLFLRTWREIIRIDRKFEGQMVSCIEQTKDGIVSIRNLNATQYFIRRAFKCSNTLLKTHYMFLNSMIWRDIRFGIINACFTTMSSLLVVLLVRYTDFGYEILSGLSLTGLYFLHWHLGTIFREIQWMNYSYVGLERCSDYISKIDEQSEGTDLLKEETRIQKKRSRKKGWSVEFKNVSLRYFPHTPIVLKNVNFRIHSGEKVLVIGRTGDGKSSLLECLFRGADFSGDVYLNEKNTKTEYTLSELRNGVSLITQQETNILSGSVRFLIDPRKKFKDEQILDVLEIVKLKKKVLGFPRQLDEENIQEEFSMGERVLLSLAKVVLLKRRVVCLDEITSGVDEEITDRIISVLKKYLKKSTIILISHRDAMKDNFQFDNTFVVKDGMVSVQFPHF